MKPIKKIKGKIESKPFGEKLLSDKDFRAVLISFGSTGVNLIYGILNGVLGIVYGSFWYLTLFAYYMILGLMRLSVATFGIRKKRTERRMTLFIGIGFILLAIVLSGSVALNFHNFVVTKHDKIIMISIAAYTFVMAFFAIRNVILAHKNRSVQMIALRNISLAGVSASMLSLQRSMITTFGDGASHFRYVMEGASGLGVFLIVLGLGISMLIYKKSNPNDDK